MAIAPRSCNTLESYGELLLAADQPEKARDQFVKAIKINADAATYWESLGNACGRMATDRAIQHDPAENKYHLLAIGAYEKAIQVDPIDTQSREHLAFQYAVMNRTDEAIQQWEEALTLLPTDAAAHGALADALRVQGDLVGAVQHYHAAINNGAKNPDWETELAWLTATRPQATVADIQPMVALAKDACEQTKYQQAAPLDAYAACLARIGEWDEATTIAQQAVAQANAAHLPQVAQGIQKRLARYQKCTPFVAGDDAPATTEAATQPTPPVSDK